MAGAQAPNAPGRRHRLGIRRGLLAFLVTLQGVVLLVLGWDLAVGRRVPSPPSLIQQVEAEEAPAALLEDALAEASRALWGGDPGLFEALFEPTLKGVSFPSRRGTPVSVGEGWQRRLWPLAGRPVNRSRGEIVASLQGFLGRFSRVEDVRFKLKSASLRGRRGVMEGEVKFRLVGRDPEGRREWVKGIIGYRARRGEGGWRFVSWAPREMESLVARRDLFAEVSGEAGLADLPEAAPAWFDYGGIVRGRGVAMADVDGDGLLDLYLTGRERGYLFRNAGDGTFREVAAEAGLEKAGEGGTGALFLDYDNDGDEDLFVASFGRQRLFQNRLLEEGRIFFRDVSEAVGVAVEGFGVSPVAGDVNGDSYPDIYVTCAGALDEGVFPIETSGRGEPNLLFVSQGDGTYREAAAEWGVAGGKWSWAACFADVDGDGRLDLYVANDALAGNSLYLHRGDRFSEEAERCGVGETRFGMGVSFGDFDNDGLLDLHVTDMSSTAGQRILRRLGDELAVKRQLWPSATGNSLYRNLGNGRFREVTQEVGGLSGGWAWGGGFVDVDNDGWLDLYTPNGNYSAPTVKDT